MMGFVEGMYAGFLRNTVGCLDLPGCPLRHTMNYARCI